MWASRKYEFSILVYTIIGEVVRRRLEHHASHEIVSSGERE
jgi:hypothetical protein